MIFGGQSRHITLTALGKSYGGGLRRALSASFTSSAAAASPQVRMLLVGSPGAGKGTLSELLRTSYGGKQNRSGASDTPSPSWLQTISAGELLRKHISAKTDVGIQAAKVTASGGLMPDSTMMEMVGREVEETGDRHWLLDGFPRTSGQAQLLDSALSKTRRPLNLVVNLDVPESVILSRILDRWVHPASGRVYNLTYNPPRRPGLDDETGEPLVQRSDDNEETFRARLKAFHSSTGPMIEHFATHSAVSILDDSKLADIPLVRLEEDDGQAAAARVYVSLTGKTSKEIWPKLQEVMSRRFGKVT